MNNIQTIISECIKGDRKHQKMLYDHTYTNSITSVSFYTKDKTECDWIFNLGMLKVFSNLEKFQKGSNYLGWARTILVRSAIDHHRKNKRYFDHLAPIINEDIDINVSELNDAMNRLEDESIIKLIHSLPEKERHIFTMFEIDGYSHVEIEKMTGINKNTSKWLLAKARKELKRKAKTFFNLNTLENGK